MKGAIKAITFAATLGTSSLVLAANCPGPDTFGHVCTTLTLATCETVTPATPTGIVGDDVCGARAIGFTYKHYGANFTTVGVHTNGYLEMGGCLLGFSDFSNDCPIPNGLTPNNSIYPAWDDFNNATGGTIQDGTFGAAPNRIYAVKWANMPYFSGTGTGTFQVQLHENGGNGEFTQHCIENASQQSYTNGMENASGTDAIMQTPCNAGAPLSSFTRYSAAAPTPTPTPGGGTCNLTPVLTAIAALETKADAADTAVAALETKLDALANQPGIADLPCQIYRLLSPRLPGRPDAAGSRCLGLLPTTCANVPNCAEVQP